MNNQRQNLCTTIRLSWLVSPPEINLIADQSADPAIVYAGFVCLDCINRQEIAKAIAMYHSNRRRNEQQGRCSLCLGYRRWGRKVFAEKAYAEARADQDSNSHGSNGLHRVCPLEGHPLQPHPGQKSIVRVAIMNLRLVGAKM